MDIRNKVGKIDITVSGEDFGVSIEIGGIENEMIGLTPMEYIQILKCKNEVSQLSKETIKNLISGLREAIQNEVPKKPLTAYMGDTPAEDFLKNLDFLKGMKVVKVDPKNMSKNPFGPGGLFSSED